MQAPTIAEALTEAGYTAVRKGGYLVLVSEPPASPCTLSIPLDAPAAMVAGRRGAQLRLWDPGGYLEDGVYTVWSPDWRPAGRARVSGARARLLEGSARLWYLVGPARWWRSPAEELLRAVLGARPWRIVAAPVYLAPTSLPATEPPPVAPAPPAGPPAWKGASRVHWWRPGEPLRGCAPT